jgi:hypothetical protein
MTTQSVQRSLHTTFRAPDANLGWAACCITCFSTFCANAQLPTLQGHVTFDWVTTEVLANSTTPSLLSPGLIEPGEALRMSLRAAFTPDVGSNVQWVVSPGFPATIAGFGGTGYRLLHQGDVAGAFTHFQAAEGFVYSATSPPNLMIFVAVLSVPPTGPNSANPLEGVFSFTWTPSSYAPRAVSFSGEPLVTTTGIVNGLHIPRRPERPDLRHVGIAGTFPDFGGTYNPTPPILIVPAPASLAVLLAGTLVKRRRR